MSEPEFSRPVRADTIGTAPRAMEIAAEPAERQALVRRFGLSALDRLEAELSVVRADQDVIVSGTLSATLTQACVVTADAVPDEIEEHFEILFRQEPESAGGDEEVELDEREMDVIFYDGASVDVGEAVAQSLALALDPYPRAPGALDALKNSGVMEPGEAGPFGALAGLKDKLGK